MDYVFESILNYFMAILKSLKVCLVLWSASVTPCNAVLKLCQLIVQFDYLVDHGIVVAAVEGAGDLQNVRNHYLLDVFVELALHVQIYLRVQPCDPTFQVAYLRLINEKPDVLFIPIDHWQLIQFVHDLILLVYPRLFVLLDQLLQLILEVVGGNIPDLRAKLLQYLVEFTFNLPYDQIDLRLRKLDAEQVRPKRLQT